MSRIKRERFLTGNNVLRIHRVFIFYKTKMAHEFDFRDFSRPVGVEMVFDFLLGDWIDKNPGKRALESALPNDPWKVKPDSAPRDGRCDSHIVLQVGERMQKGLLMWFQRYVLFACNVVAAGPGFQPPLIRLQRMKRRDPGFQYMKASVGQNGRGRRRESHVSYTQKCRKRT